MLASQARLLTGEPLMTEEAVAALREHARRAYPQECVGAVLDDGSYQPLENASSSPEVTAHLSSEALLGLLQSGRLRALCHSHPDGPDAPSAQDMRSQWEMSMPFVIVSTNGEATLPPFAWGDTLVEAPLLGRPFRHGVTDCYALIRSYYRQERGVVLGDYPRDWEWWNGEANLYEDNFSREGFLPTDPAGIREGDVWLAAVRSKVANHAGVYLGEGLALHHASSRLAYDPARLSKREPLARWAPFITHWIRRD